MYKNRGLKGTVFASLALAFASFGDAFLYPFLPVNNASVGVPVMWIGILLSINRFVRIVSNAFMVRLFDKYGIRRIMILAVIMAILSTAGYAVADTVLIWLLLRICWGLSFSAMRIGTLGHALQSSRQGVALGIGRSIQEFGPMVTLFLTPILLNYFETRTIFFFLVAFSLPAIYFAWHLPAGEDRNQAIKIRKFPIFPSTFNSITLLSAILIDGIMVVVLGILIQHYNQNITLITVTTLTAFYLAYRRVCLVVLSPVGGWVADKFGLTQVFNISIVLVIAGLFILTTGWIAIGSILVFTFYSIHATITPGAVLKNKDNTLVAVAENATWRDIGAAVGTLLGGILMKSEHLINILLIATFVLVFLFLIHLSAVKKTHKIYLWK
jgi:MFS transporter, DHA1 family, multidrug resistance protein